jgi:hypothetical protein
MDFLKKCVSLDQNQIQRLQTNIQEQSKSNLWRDAREIRITASSAHKVPIKDTTDCTNFIREHLYPTFLGNKHTKYRQEQEPMAKDHLRSTGLLIEDRGICVSTEEIWLSANPDGVINGDTLLEVKCSFPIPTKWTCLDELVRAGKYDVVKTGQNSYKLKVKGRRDYYLQIQLTMFCAYLRKCKLLIWRCKDDYILVDVQYNADYVHEQI